MAGKRVDACGTLFKEPHNLAVARITQPVLFTIRPWTAPSMMAPIMFGRPACQESTGRCFWGMADAL
jgi:hypothetical protein